MAESVTPQPSPARILAERLAEHDGFHTVNEPTLQGYIFEAEQSLEALSVAGFRIVSPGWEIVKLRSAWTKQRTEDGPVMTLAENAVVVTERFGD